MYKIKCGGIYIITHQPTGQYYIGCSVDILSNRWGGHYTNLVMNKHHSPQLQQLFNNSKIEDFTFQILERIGKTYIKEYSNLKGKELDKVYKRVLLMKEKEWMSKYSINLSLNKNNKHFK